ncbi:MAG: SdpI family protein [Nanoarchaeota archaeon]|nr:SdpI family protein [Nanoarchaeota archaeon]
MRKAELFVLIAVIISFIIGIYFYPQMPEQMASHWNAQGNVDGYMSRFWGVFLMPFVFVGLALLFITIPKIDPLKKNIEEFRKYYDGFIILFFIFMLLVYMQTILWNLGTEISPNIVIPIGLGLLFYYIGILFENTKRNWFIGIKTPWTLSSEKVWNKTHKLGSKMFKTAGIIVLTGFLFQKYATYFILVPILFVALYLVVYSYVEYQKEKK